MASIFQLKSDSSSFDRLTWTASPDDRSSEAPIAMVEMTCDYAAAGQLGNTEDKNGCHG
jgi:hypothetical protein